MKTDQEYQRVIKDAANWQQVSDNGMVRTFRMAYKGAEAYRSEVLKDGKWRKQCWYRFNPACMTVKMDRHDFVRYLREIDRQRPDQEVNNAE